MDRWWICWMNRWKCECVDGRVEDIMSELVGGW